MKLPKSNRSAFREIDRVVEKVLSKVDTSHKLSKAEVDHLFDLIIQQVARHRGLDVEQVGAVTSEVIPVFGNHYRQLDDQVRGWETFVALLYLEYHQALGIDITIFNAQRR